MIQGTLDLAQPFSLGLTLLCGQCFRWEGPDAEGWFTGVAGAAFWRLKQDQQILHWECNELLVRGKNPPEWLGHYLQLDVEMEEWYGEFKDHPILGIPLQTLRGLRILRQEPWECTISYMFAQGLSVKVIRHALKNFCAKNGKWLEGYEGFYSFPEAGDIARLSPAILRPYTNNYQARADRIIRLARAVEARVILLEHLKNIPCDEARETLMALDGIGPKIADCILLFSMDQESAFPIDRWVLRAMKRHFRSVKLLDPGEEAPTRAQYSKIVHKARRAFGTRCGLASQYLFVYLRIIEDGNLRKELGPYCQNFDRIHASEKSAARQR